MHKQEISYELQIEGWICDMKFWDIEPSFFALSIEIINSFFGKFVSHIKW